MPAVILSPNPDWRLALSAMLQQRGVRCMDTDDVAEAVTAARSVSSAFLVAHSQMPADELRVLIRACARSGPSLALALAGVWTPSDPDAEAAVRAHFEQAFAFGAIVEWVVRQSGDELWLLEAPSPAAPAQLPFDGSAALAGPSIIDEVRGVWESPMSPQKLDDLLVYARHHDPHVLLGLERPWQTPLVDVHRAWALAQLTDEAAGELAQVCRAQILELRGAVADATLALSLHSTAD
jgi:hypothetical protein